MVTRAVTQRYDAFLQPSGLRITQYSLLMNIARAGSITVDRLTDVMAIDQTTLTRSLTLLEHSGLIQRAPHPDQRVRAVELTHKGMRTLDRARPLWAQAQAHVLEAVDQKLWRQTESQLARLLAIARPNATGTSGRSRLH